VIFEEYRNLKEFFVVSGRCNVLQYRKDEWTKRFTAGQEDIGACLARGGSPYEQILEQGSTNIRTVRSGRTAER
jgi:hypothetical protein